jgi:hypothetical protein
VHLAPTIFPAGTALPFAIESFRASRKGFCHGFLEYAHGSPTLSAALAACDNLQFKMLSEPVKRFHG